MFVYTWGYGKLGLRAKALARRMARRRRKKKSQQRSPRSQDFNRISPLAEALRSGHEARGKVDEWRTHFHMAQVQASGLK